ncbi:DUF2322 family protein [Chitinilyticum litopenaei]|uniref:DUF2322 family protein n=1 Tax=Chitinilyticum litopenaei TaxID=1121276 RepID=UPI0004167ABA|nr:DUF2322 family protein [Chitinilyticum litopenaei]
MSTFADHLAGLPGIDHLAALELLHGDSIVARIENKPGQAGSLRVYHALYQEFGCINAVAADKGIRLYAEHSEDARANPGKHPNIDRLFAVDAAQPFAVRLIENSKA